MLPKSYEEVKEAPGSLRVNLTLIDCYDQVSPYTAGHKDVPDESPQLLSSTRKGWAYQELLVKLNGVNYEWSCG